FGDLRMDQLTREVTRGDRRLDLTRTEYLLLELFLTHPRQVLTRDQILSEVWGFDFEPSSNSLDVYVMYLRRKTEAGGEPRVIQTVRGVGYVLRHSPRERSDDEEAQPALAADPPGRRGGGDRGGDLRRGLLVLRQARAVLAAQQVAAGDRRAGQGHAGRGA